MQLVQYDPFKHLQTFQHDLNDFWNGGWGLMPGTESSAMDMYEENGKLIAEISLPNFKKNEVKVVAENGILEISAEHSEKKEDKSKRRYYLQESDRQYWRRVALPEGAQADKAAATFKDGILKVTMPAGNHKKIAKKAISVK